MDVLSDILNSIKLKPVIYRKALMTTSSWGIEMAQDSNSQFWRLLKGACYLKMQNATPIKMSVGDIVFIPHGASHSLSGSPQNFCVPASQYTKALLSGNPLFQGNEEETVLIGGHLEIDSDIQHPFIKYLPKLIHISNLQTEINVWLNNIAAFMNEELSGQREGSKLILSRVADIFFLLIIRVYLEQENIGQGFLYALSDGKISNSLKSMHEFPDKEWKIEQLAAKAGMSRSSYCREFKRLVCDTPMGYLTDWRIMKSKEFLLSSKENISDVAARVGYSSEAAFNRLFKSKVGETPANYRRKSLNKMSI
jgi:AraC-like DNA-binding protein